MRVATLELSAWRNYASQKLEFRSSPTILVGKNGQGKTNLIEAIVYASLGRSHRTWSDSTLVRNGDDKAIVRMRVEHGQRKLDIDLVVTSSGSNTVRVNGNTMKKRELARLLPLVIFAPEDMEIVRGEPENRRHFLDDILSETQGAIAADLADYDRILKQRNSLLKSLRGSVSEPESETLSTWTESLVAVAARIMRARREVVREMQSLVTHHYSAIAGVDDIASITLTETTGDGVEDADIEKALYATFHVKRSDEIDRGTTLVGPHRDDLLLVLNGLFARTHSSQGEAWSFALALRLAMVDVVRRHSAVGDPVVILDDVFSELDEGRRTRLGAHVTEIEQLIITAADESTIPATIVGERHAIEGGTIHG